MSDEAAKEAFKEKLRSLTFGAVPGGNRPKQVSRPGRPIPNAQSPSWEAGPVYDYRPNGERVPLVHASNLEPITVKQFANRRGHYTTQLEKLDGARHHTGSDT